MTYGPSTHLAWVRDEIRIVFVDPGDVFRNAWRANSPRPVPDGSDGSPALSARRAEGVS